MLVSALNPKVSLLQKLARMVYHFCEYETGDHRVDVLDGIREIVVDSEVVEWLNRMTELQYVQKQVAYQLCATLMPIEEEWATYAECQDHQAALDRCFKEFPIIINYTQHHVKVIGTGEIIYPGRARTLPITQTSINDVGEPSTYVADRLAEMIEPQGKAKAPGLSLNELESPPELNTELSLEDHAAKLDKAIEDADMTVDEMELGLKL